MTALRVVIAEDSLVVREGIQEVNLAADDNVSKRVKAALLCLAER